MARRAAGHIIKILADDSLAQQVAPAEAGFALAQPARLSMAFGLGNLRNESTVGVSKNPAVGMLAERCVKMRYDR